MIKKILNFHHARAGQQTEKMKKIASEKICPFCPKYLAKYHDAPIEKKGRYWAVTQNDYPYEGSRWHFLFIHRRHIEQASQITGPAFAELSQHLKYLIKKYKLPAGGFFMRFGNSDYTGATVIHLHAHLIVGGARNKKTKPLDVPLGYKIQKK